MICLFLSGDEEGIMASRGLEKFEPKGSDRAISDDWRVWKAIFVAHCKTAGLKFTESDDEDLIKQTLISNVGSTGVRTLMGMDRDDWAAASYADMMKELDARFIVESEMSAIMTFHNMSIEPDETIEDYVYRLKPAAAAAKQNNDKEIILKLLKDSSIHKLPDAKVILSELIKDNMTLKDFFSWDTRRRLTQKLINDSTSSNTCLALNRVTRNRFASSSSQQSNRSEDSIRSTKSDQSYRRKSECWYCKRKDFPHEKQCPAKGKQCRTCNKTGHFAGAKKCRQYQKVNTVENESDSENETSPMKSISCVKMINSTDTRRNPTQIICLGYNDLVNITPDTGSECNVLTYETYLKLCEKQELRKTSAKLLPFDSANYLETAGEIRVPMT